MVVLLSLRLERLVLMRDCKNKIQDRADAVQMMCLVIKPRTYKALIRVMQAELKKFFNFTDCVILFYSHGKEMLFTIQEKENEENEEDEQEFFA